MPKIRDLGITVLPEGVGPVGIGGGAGGACGCTDVTNPCLGCTRNFHTGAAAAAGICGCTHITNPCIGCTHEVTLPNCVGCSHITNPCLGCTRDFTLTACGNCTITNPCIGCTQEVTLPPCGPCSHITNPCVGCTRDVTLTACGGCSHITNPCLGCTKDITFVDCRFGTCGLTHTPCGGGTRWPTTDPTTITPHTPVIRPGELSETEITTIRQQLRQRLEALDAHERSLGDQHFEQREARLVQELEQLKARRGELKK